jgi:NitT/TauT family transport system substrate-binding protein
MTNHEKGDDTLFIHLKYALRGCLLIALLVTACAPAGVEQNQPESVALKVGILPYISYAPFFIATEEGHFAEQGLQVELVRPGNVSEAIVALVQGDLDVAGGTVNCGYLNAMARGAKIRYVADKSYVSPTSCTYAAFIARRALVEAGELDNPAQLSGRRIAIPDSIRASVLGYYIEAMLKTTDLTLDDIKIVNLPSPAQMEALEEGTVDLILTGEPWVSRILNAGHAVLWMPVQQVVPDYQHATILYGHTLLEEHPDAGRRFMVAYLKAVRQYNQGKTERNLEIVAEYTGLERELLDQLCLPPIRNDGRINVDSVLDFQAWAVEKGYLDSPVTEEQFWDPSFVEYANEVLGASSQ